jgi:hypothetical protein
LDITSDQRITEWNVSWIVIPRTVAVVDTRFSNFANSSLRIACSNISRTARASD